MKKSLLYMFVAGAALLSITSCKKNNEVIDQGIVPPGAAKFNTYLAADTIATYYIRSTNDPFKLPIGVTTVSGQNRTINLTYTSSSAVMGTQYNAPSSLVIPAGKTIDTLSVTGLFAGCPLSSRRDTVRIKIAGGDVEASPYKNTYTLIMRKYCDVTLSAFYGNYTKAIDNGNYGPYPMTVVNGSAVSTGATSGTLQVTNLWDPGVPTTTTVALDWSNPSGFTVTIPDQAYYTPAGLWVKGTTAGTFSSCDQTFTFRYTLYYKATGANYSANQVTTLAR